MSKPTPLSILKLGLKSVGVTDATYSQKGKTGSCLLPNKTQINLRMIWSRPEEGAKKTICDAHVEVLEVMEGKSNVVWLTDMAGSCSVLMSGRIHNANRKRLAGWVAFAVQAAAQHAILGGTDEP